MKRLTRVEIFLMSFFCIVLGAIYAIVILSSTKKNGYKREYLYDANARFLASAVLVLNVIVGICALLVYNVK